MTLPFKAVAVDMDGTFLDDRKQFNHKEFDQILTEFEQRGVHFIVASGRPYVRLKQAVSYTHLTLPTTLHECRSRWSPYH